MRIFGLGFVVAAALTVFAPGLAAAADSTPGKAPEITKEARAKGMSDAPALLTAAGSDCQLADARFVGSATDPKTNVKSSLYEVACTGGEGLLLLQAGPAGTPPGVFTCMEAAAVSAQPKKNATQCGLPGNLDPKAGLVPYIAKAGVACTPDKVRAIGHTATNVFFEVQCHEYPGGFVYQLSLPPRADKPATATPCVVFDASNPEHCELSDRPAQLSQVDVLAKASGKPCVIKDRGFIGVAQSGSTFYEVACQDGKGYVLEQSANGSFSRAIPCTEADALAGGCKLTDSRQAKTEQNSLYSSLAKKAGFDCTVSAYGPFAVNMPGKEVVELACSNRPDGAVGIFPASASETATVYDCAHAALKGYRCSLSKPEGSYPKFTADLRTLGKNTCTVSESRVIGVTADQQGYIEVGCSDGLPGFVIQYTLTPVTPKAVINCSEASGINGGCSLPGNTKK